MSTFSFPTQTVLTPGMRDLAYDLFYEISDLRKDPLSYASSLTNIVAKKAITGWVNHTQHLQWNEALARAARHVLNEQGSCGTMGDAYGNSFEEVLRKYYAFHVDGLDYIEITSPYIVD